MLVHDVTFRSEHGLPSPFPGLVADVGVLDVKRVVERIQAAQQPEFANIDRARPASRPEYGRRGLVVGLDRVMPKTKEAVLELSARFSGFFPATRGVRERDLRCCSKD